MRTNRRIITFSAILLVCFCATIFAQGTRDRISGGGCTSASAMSGVYRIDADASDKLYSVIEGATSNVPYSDQQQFFTDLAVRLTPPDLLAIECRGNQISLGSSRAPRVDFVADGVPKTSTGADGRVVRSRIGFERDSLTFNSSGGNDNLNFTFTPLDGGRQMRVTRRISARELIEPVVIRTVYNKISDVARWEVFDDARTAERTTRKTTVEPTRTSAVEPTRTTAAVSSRVRSVGSAQSEVDELRDALNLWLDATNGRSFEGQMAFYMPVLKSFYLARNASRGSVRAEKIRTFASAKSIDIRAEEPEIIFQDGGRTAIMRFRKKYRIAYAARNRSGEVVQELRWQKTNDGWKIFSERDIRVIS